MIDIMLLTSIRFMNIKYHYLNVLNIILILHSFHVIVSIKLLIENKKYKFFYKKIKDMV